MKQISIFIILVVILGCSHTETIFLSDKNEKYYYCAYLADAIDFQISNKINSIKEFDEYVNELKKQEDNVDANYYKIIKKNTKTMLYGYSMKTNELREVMILNSKNKRLLSRKTFKPYGNKDKRCQWSYNNLNNKLISTKQCDDNSKTIMYIEYSQRDNRYITREYSIYKSNKLIDKIIYDKHGIPINDEGAEGGAYDVCIPFRAYRIGERIP